jgi:DNA mismatch repair protein MutL
MPDAPARIHVLPGLLINQIAAGEVIERPASVVKELLENSFDAGAQRIEIELQDSGVKLIRVRDDGTGIEQEDLKLALCRHATSKLQSLADLDRVLTLGFRGEALPSIASVSRLQMISRVRDTEVGWKVSTEGQDQVVGPEPAPHGAGTTVEVRDLFFNTPARRKFLRSDRTEFIQILQLVKRMAVSRFDVGLRLTHNQRQLLNLRAAQDRQGVIQRIREICGAPFMDKAVEVDSSTEGLRVWGWLSLPEAARSQNDLQYLFLNGRAIRDKSVAHAIRRAYEDDVFEGKHPQFVLYLEMNPEWVDVNVHPTKTEVRFTNTRLLHDFIYSVVNRALREGSAPTANKPNQDMFDPTPSGRSEPPPRQPSIPRIAESWGMYTTSKPQTGPRSPARPVPSISSESPPHQVMGLLQDKYLLVGNTAGLMVIDIAAAWERLIAEELRQACKTGGVNSKPLLIPESVTLAEAELRQVMHDQILLARLGFQIDLAGPTAVMVRGVPAPLPSANWPEMVQGIAVFLASTSGGPAIAEQEQPLIDCIARHGRETHNPPKSPDDLTNFLSRLESIGWGNNPNARGLWRQLSLEDLGQLLRVGA